MLYKDTDYGISISVPGIELKRYDLFGDIRQGDGFEVAFFYLVEHVDKDKSLGSVGSEGVVRVVQYDVFKRSWKSAYDVSFAMWDNAELEFLGNIRAAVEVLDNQE